MTIRDFLDRIRALRSDISFCNVEVRYTYSSGVGFYKTFKAYTEHYGYTPECSSPKDAIMYMAAKMGIDQPKDDVPTEKLP